MYCFDMKDWLKDYAFPLMSWKLHFYITTFLNINELVFLRLNFVVQHMCSLLCSKGSCAVYGPIFSWEWAHFSLKNKNVWSAYHSLKIISKQPLDSSLSHGSHSILMVKSFTNCNPNIFSFILSTLSFNILYSAPGYRRNIVYTLTPFLLQHPSYQATFIH